MLRNATAERPARKRRLAEPARVTEHPGPVQRTIARSQAACSLVRQPQAQLVHHG